MPAATNSYTIEALKGQAVTAQLKETVNQVTQRVGRRIFEHALRYSGYVSLPSSLPFSSCLIAFLTVRSQSTAFLSHMSAPTMAYLSSLRSIEDAND
jgi:hypothetical protein